MGFPIRKCPDQSLFAAPRTLSQRTTSFIASQRQGIHRILLRHLIVLINNARRSAAAPPKSPSRMIQAKTALSQKDQICLPNVPEPLRGQAEAQHTTRQAGHGLHADPRDGQPAFRTRSLSTMTVNPRIPANQDRKLQCLQHESKDEPRTNPWKRQHRHVAPDTPDRPKIELVEPDGIEPTTSCLQSTRSPN